LIRFDHEMNGSWFSWSESRNGNSRGQFVPAWRHVVDIFRQAGATNATFVWAPNRVWPAAIPLAGLYPGDAYVDWVGMSAYNWGTNPAKPNNLWQTPTQVFKETYDALGSLAPTKPIMIAETSSSEWGGSKSAWTSELLGTRIPSWPRIKAFVWFNWNAPATAGNMDWVIESSSSAQSAFRSGIASSVYAANNFASLPRGTKVIPLGGAAAPPPATTTTIKNGSFETTGTSPWFSPWTVRNDLGATIAQDTTASAGSRSFKASLAQANPTQPWVVQLRQSGQTTTAGRTATLSFSAKASSARTITAALQKTASPYNVYVEKDVSLTTSWQRFTVTVTPTASDSAVSANFHLAKTTGTVWIDDVSLVS
jgi:hypothetical protein